MDQKRYEIIILPRAELHLEGIIAYIARDNPERALSFGQEIVATANRLADEPLLGHEYRGARKGLRVLNHGSYQIIYKAIESSRRVEIMAFWHGARMPPEI